MCATKTDELLTRSGEKQEAEKLVHGKGEIEVKRNASNRSV